MTTPVATVTHSKTLVSPSTGTADKVYGSDYVSASSHTVAWSGLGTNQLLYSTGATALANGGSFDGTTLSVSVISLPDGTLAAPSIILGSSGAGFYKNSTAASMWTFAAGGTHTDSFRLTQAEICFVGNGILTWGNQVNTFTSSSNDTGVKRSAAGVIRITDSSTGGGALELLEMTAPAGLANSGRLFTQDNGAGKTQLMVIFGSGAAIQLAIEV